MRFALRPLSFIALAAAAAAGSLACARQSTVAYQSPSALAAAPVFPGATWDSIADPRTVGWTRSGLDSVRAQLTALPSTGFVAIVGGRILMSYGDLQTVSYLASVRKSLLSMLMGNYVRRGTIDLNRTLAQLGMDDVGGWSDQEKEATVKDLLTARSGVYHAASNAGDDLASAPPRGSQRHGTYMLYSNWDFNALGGAFELMTGRDIYDALESDIVRPISMQDFDRATHRKTGDSTRSRYLAYHMNFSTRDMARVGYLMLRRRCPGTQVSRPWAILNMSLSEALTLARKPNFNFEKRSKELARQAKRDRKEEEKLRRKREAEAENQPAPPADPNADVE
ncbi:MAG: serine hydrolase [Gemmatimonadaceae bacterium]